MLHLQQKRAVPSIWSSPFFAFTHYTREKGRISIMETTPPTNLTQKPLKLDISRYQHYLDATRLSPGDKEELLHTLWNLTCEFVYLGFGVSAVQQVVGLDHSQLKTLENSDSNDSKTSLDSTYPTHTDKD